MVKIFQNGPKWFKVMKNGQKGQNGLKWSKMVKMVDIVKTN